MELKNIITDAKKRVAKLLENNKEVIQDPKTKTFKVKYFD